MTADAGTFVALLRGINVGGHNKVPMAELRALCANLGWGAVQTYIQSGNVVFRAKGRPQTLQSALEQAILRTFNLSIPVIVRTADAWAACAEANPMKAACARDPQLVHLVLSRAKPATGAVTALRERAAGGELIERVDDALWIYFRSGAGRSKLTPAVLDRLVGSPATARNWRTVRKLCELSAHVTG
jgi:uncharacterized protein (DUF1697 family)